MLAMMMFTWATCYYSMTEYRSFGFGESRINAAEDACEQDFNILDK